MTDTVTQQCLQSFLHSVIKRSGYREVFDFEITGTGIMVKTELLFCTYLGVNEFKGKYKQLTDSFKSTSSYGKYFFFYLKEKPVERTQYGGMRIRVYVAIGMAICLDFKDSDYENVLIATKMEGLI